MWNKRATMTPVRAWGFPRRVSWVRYGAGRSVRGWATRLAEVQEPILRPLAAEKLPPVA